MTTLVEELKEIILRALPNISEAVQQLIIDRLLSSGLDSTEDLKYVKQEDIADLLPVIQQQKRLDAFKMGMYVCLQSQHYYFIIHYNNELIIFSLWPISYFCQF